MLPADERTEMKNNAIDTENVVRLTLIPEVRNHC